MNSQVLIIYLLTTQDMYRKFSYILLKVTFMVLKRNSQENIFWSSVLSRKCVVTTLTFCSFEITASAGLWGTSIFEVAVRYLVMVVMLWAGAGGKWFHQFIK